MGDIGGLIDALKLIAALVVSTFGNNNLMNSLISRLFYTTIDEESSIRVPSDGARDSRTEVLQSF